MYCLARKRLWALFPLPQKWTEGNQASWPTLIIPAYGRLRPEDCHKFAASWDWTVSFRPAGLQNKTLSGKKKSRVSQLRRWFSQQSVCHAVVRTCTPTPVSRRKKCQRFVRFLDKGAYLLHKPRAPSSVPVSLVAVAGHCS